MLLPICLVPIGMGLVDFGAVVNSFSRNLDKEV
jgi:hypothetical protein